MKVNSYHVANKGRLDEYNKPKMYNTYSAFLGSSPWTIEVNSTYVDAKTTSAGGAEASGLSFCTASIECYFTVEVRDRFYNTRFEWGGGEVHC